MYRHYFKVEFNTDESGNIQFQESSLIVSADFDRMCPEGFWVSDDLTVDISKPNKYFITASSIFLIEKVEQ